MKKIKNLGYDIILKKEKYLTFSEDIKDVDVLVCYNPFDTLDISKLGKLKWIQLSSVGIDQVPMEHLIKNNITLTNNKGGYSIPMGEWVVMKTLELFKNSREMYINQLNKKWHMDTSLLELYGKTIGFIGTGTIASESAKRLQGFDVNTLGVNTTGRDVEYFGKCYSLDNINEVIPKCDVVVLTIPYTQSTHHMVDKKFLKLMKKEAYLINVSRGSIIKEKDIITALKNNDIKGAALDVFENEPLDENNPLWDFENVIITCHNSWISEMRNERRYDTIYENMKRFLNNDKLKNVINLEKGY
ncbi:phosphoglycerate dehydrogenase [Dethiothermospora halolimnae]|uniref:phosphoglycerate dehydrogenase n=1 Tax=Dethiothermospora halolimnae TaxID=3114390 RepID=UPI003CCBA56D